MNKSTKHPRLITYYSYTRMILYCSKIPIAITRVRKAPGEARARGGAVGKLELNKGNNKQLKRQETLRSVRTIKKVPNFKKLHKQFEAHIARVSAFLTDVHVTVTIKCTEQGEKEAIDSVCRVPLKGECIIETEYIIKSV